MKTKVLIGGAILALGVAALSLPAYAGDPGTTSAVELQLPVGPRAIAMGGAFSAVADDANSIYWNPAGLRQLGGVHILTQYTDFIDTVKYEYFAVALPVSNHRYGLGLGVKMVSSGTADEIDSQGNLTGSKIGLTYMDVNLAGACKLGYNFDLGFTVKYLSETLKSDQTESASTFAVDGGLTYRTPVKNLTCALVIQNALGPGLKYDGVSSRLPLNFKVGTAYKLFDKNCTVALDLNFPNDNKPAVTVGGEYWYRDRIAGRCGYQYQGGLDWNQTDVGGMGGLYLGAGLKLPLFGVSGGLDYAWSTQGFLGTVHRVALNVYI